MSERRHNVSDTYSYLFLIQPLLECLSQQLIADFSFLFEKKETLWIQFLTEIRNTVPL